MSDHGPPFPADDELRNLVEKLADETISADEHQSLEARLRTEPPAQDFYLAFMDLQARLRWLARGNGENDETGQGETGQGPVVSEAVACAPAPDASPKMTVLGFLDTAVNLSAAWLSSPKALAITVVGGLATYFVGLMISIAISRALLTDRNAQHPADAPEHAPARIVATANCRWQDGALTGNVDSHLPAGTSSLAAGIVELEFAGGARVRIAGPAEFAPRSGGRLELARGRVTAYVPKRARGFTVDTPTAEVVDLGTEFGVEVDGQGQTSIKVLTGKVDVLVDRRPGGSGQPVRVEAGQAVRVGRDKQIATVPFDEQKLVSPLQPDANIRQPTDVPGLRLWLTTQRGLVTDEAGFVTRWADQSGHGYDATQSEAARRPLLVGPFEQGAGVVLRFDGIDDCLECTRGLDLDNAGDGTFFLLLRRIGEVKPNLGIFSLCSREHADWNSADGFALVLAAKPRKSLQAIAAWPYGSNPASDPLDFVAELPDDGPYLLNVTKKQGTATLRLNGTTRQVDSFAIRSDGGQFSVNTGGFLIGARSDDGGHQRPGRSLFGNFEIAEILVYSVAVTGTEGTAIEQFLTERSDAIRAAQ